MNPLFCLCSKPVKEDSGAIAPGAFLGFVPDVVCEDCVEINGELYFHGDAFPTDRHGVLFVEICDEEEFEEEM